MSSNINFAFFWAIGAILHGIFLLVIPLIYLHYKQVEIKPIFSIYTSWSGILLWILVGGFIGDLTIKYIVTSNFIEKISQLHLSNINLIKVNWVNLLLTISLIPISEEFFFRGFLYSKLINKFNYHLVILFTATIWTLTHWPPSLSIYILLILSGIILGYSRFFTGSIFVPILVHIAFNLSSITLSILK